jgi:cyclophilin family peptidyl-prolyl cis-trans isomerase
MRGLVAATALTAAFDKKGAGWWALRRASLAALARVDTAAFARRAAVWLTSPDLRERLSALEAWGTIKGADPVVFRTALADSDAAVQAGALDAWQASAIRGDSALTASARARLTSPRSAVRASAAQVLRAAATLDDLDPLLTSWRLSAGDGDSDARLAIFRTLSDLAHRNPDLMARLEEPGRRRFLVRPADALVRREAERSWPAVAAQWGPVGPVETGRSLEDYRGIVRTLMLATANPHVTIDTDGRGAIDIELLAHDAPLTVANFLRLVDRHYFDGIRWHRVVPNFVVQAGDPTGTGNGSPGWVIRDEINRWRYELPVVGMALSGPDTGGSQWFINLSSQPHLDGSYTVFGQVSGSYTTLFRIVQGDLIRSIHR